jgi:hypothetical protein
VVSVYALILLIALVAPTSLAEDMLIPEDEEDPAGGGGEAALEAPSVPTAPSDPRIPQVPSVPGTGIDVPDEEVSDGIASPVETLPPEKDEVPFITPQSPLYLVVALVVIGVMTTYAPGEIRRMRIEAALRASMDGRLALAMGDFIVALTAFDRAIDQAHTAYTRRWRVDRPAEWRLLPDSFYISLWRGRAAALMGMGRKKSAVATSRLADELEAAVDTE